MFIIVVGILFPLTNAFVAVQIHQNSIYIPDSQCSFIDNKTSTNEISIESCIWECVHQLDCQTAIFFKNDRICSMFKERCDKGLIQPSFNEFIHLICYKKNHNPISTCSSTLTTDLNNEETTTSINIATTDQLKTKIRLTRKNDSIFGICKTIAGGNSTPSYGPGVNQCQYYYDEIPSYAIDNNNLTKYTNFGNGHSTISSMTYGCDTGFYLTPSIGPTILNGIRFITANNLEDRDPMTITIEGSTNITSLTIGSSWTWIYSGSSGLDTDPGRYHLGIEQSINNTISYTSYRLLVTSKRGIESSVQYSEAILLGYH